MILLGCTKRGQAIVARLVVLVSGLTRIRCQIEEEEVATEATKTEATAAAEATKTEATESAEAAVAQKAIEMDRRDAIKMDRREAIEVDPEAIEVEEPMETLKLIKQQQQ